MMGISGHNVARISTNPKVRVSHIFSVQFGTGSITIASISGVEPIARAIQDV